MKVVQPEKKKLIKTGSAVFGTVVRALVDGEYHLVLVINEPGNVCGPNEVAVADVETGVFYKLDITQAVEPVDAELVVKERL